MRNNKIDNIKGILIILMVFAHFLLTYKYVELKEYSMIINFIYIFHMPLFFLISGELTKKVNFQRIYKYLMIFILMIISFTFYDYFTYGYFNLFSLKYSSWFLLLLISYRLILSNNKIKKVFNNKIVLVILFLLSLLSGFIKTDLFILRFIYFLFFFMLGNYNLEKLKINKKICYILLTTNILFFITLSSIARLDLLMGGYFINSSDIFIRLSVLITVPFLYLCLCNIIPNKKIKFITKIGEYSLLLYLLHRIPSLIINDYFYISKYYLIISIVMTIIFSLIIILLAKYLNIIIEKIVMSKVFIVITLLLIVIPFNGNIELNIKEEKELDDSISIGFVGDLIILEDELKNSNNNFDYYFNNISNYFNKTDYVFGVLEGPVDDNSEYSYGNFSDNKELHLNYPTIFLDSIKDSGIDMVTISNNHILDRGVEAYKNTIKNLDNKELDYIGKKNDYRIINIKGLKVGVLAYTYDVNYHPEGYKEVTNYLVDPNDLEFNNVKEKIETDFKILKNNNVDLIIVLPHYGTQFSKRVDIYQETYNRLFVSLGANIIFGDHSHRIQPINYYNDSVIINSPGNYLNSYIEDDGDIGMYVKVYINKNKKVIGTSITPIISEKEGNLYKPKLLLESNNKERVKNIIGNTIFNRKIKEDKNTYYYMNNKSLKYDNKYQLELTDKDKESIVYKKIEEHNRICFIGDSITEGTKNNYHPWYEELMNNFDKDVINLSKGSYTTEEVINDLSDRIINSNCDLSIINIGTNDIRYYKRDVNDYINNMKKIISYTKGEVIVLAPWETTKKDYNIEESDKKKRELYNIYNKELEKLDNIIFINPNKYIKEVLDYNGEDYYLLDGIHPNNDYGIKLYSYAVLR